MPVVRAMGQFVAHVVAGDFNGDGLADVAAIVDSGRVALLLQRPGGDVSIATYAGPAAPAEAIAAGDFDGDGRLDLATTNVNGTVSVLLRTCLP
jgi:hypothetical protein